MKRSPEKIATLREMAPNANAREIARVLGVSSVCVANWAAQKGIRLMTKTQAMKALHADPEFKAKLSKSSSARMKALHADPEFKAAAAARMKALNAEPEEED
jgi:DNA polymerase III alpha subunit